MAQSLQLNSVCFCDHISQCQRGATKYFMGRCSEQEFRGETTIFQRTVLGGLVGEYVHVLKDPSTPPHWSLFREL